MNRFTTNDGLLIAYADQGDGQPVVCLPGLTRNMADFDDLAAIISGTCRIIRMDYRGRGASDHDPDPMNYAVPIEARDVVELLDHLGLAKVTIIGTSRGGLIAMGLAATVPERLAGVVLNDVGPVVDMAGLEAIRQYIGRNPGFDDFDMAAERLSAVNAASFPDVPKERWRNYALRTWTQTASGLVINYDPKLRDAVIATMEAPPVDLWPFFDALAGIPLGLIRGANSDILSAETAGEMRQRRPDMVFGEIANRGHVPFLDEPGAIDVISRVMTDAKRA